MSEFLSDEWFETVRDAGAALPSIEGLSFSFDVEITETASGKVRAHGHIADGRLASFESGKFVPETKGEKAQVSFAGKAKRLLPIIQGERPALVAYMLGELKVDGEYELVVDRMANESDHAALETFRATVASATQAD